jgi:hypothetical protein
MKCADALKRLKPAQDEFALRYYRWCLEDSERERQENFPLVKEIRSFVAFLFLEFIDSCGSTEIRNLMTCGIKRNNSRAVELASENISEAERDIHQKYIKYFTKEITWQGQQLTSLRMPLRESQIRDRELSGQTSTTIKSADLKRALKQALRPASGPTPRSQRATLEYCQTLDSWYVLTNLDFSGKAQLAYSHQISPRRTVDFCPTYLYGGISLLNWCGIHPNTSFDLIQTNEIDDVAESMRKICGHFLEKVPQLTSGLKHDVPEILEDAGQFPLSGAM